MKPPKTVFACQECGGQQQKWLGRCPDCGAWNSFVEEQPAPQTAPAAANSRYNLVSASASAKLYAASLWTLDRNLVEAARRLRLSS